MGSAGKAHMPAARRGSQDRSTARSGKRQANHGIGRFIKGRKIGAGGFGCCYLCTSAESGNRYVIKEVSTRGMSATDQDAALREVNILKKLRHPNIIAYKDSYKSDGKLSIIMEYASGGDVYGRIQKQKGRLFPETVVVNWVVQMLLALKYLHDNKLLHRDLKPQNMFLTSTGVIKLGDFGVARILDGTLACAHTQIGTPFYLSPEICRNKPYDAKSDMWSLGCVLYELLTLRPPFMAKDMRGMVEAILHGTPKPVSNLYSTELRTLVLTGLLNRDPLQRLDVRSCLRERFVRSAAQQMLGSAQNDSKSANSTSPSTAAPAEGRGGARELSRAQLDKIVPPKKDALDNVLEVLNRDKSEPPTARSNESSKASPLKPQKVSKVKLPAQPECVHRWKNENNQAEAAAQIQAMMRNSWRRKGKSGYKPTPIQQPVAAAGEPVYFDIISHQRRANSTRQQTRYEEHPDEAAAKIQKFMRNSLKRRQESQNRLPKVGNNDPIQLPPSRYGGK